MHFLIKKFSPISLSVSVFFLLYTVYKAEIKWKGAMDDYYIIYYAFSIILVLMSIFTFSLKEKVKEYLILIITSTIFSLFLFEGYLSFNYIKYVKIQNSSHIPMRERDLDEKIKIYKDKTGKQYDTRSSYEIFKDLKRTENNISLASSPLKIIKEKFGFFHFSGASFSKTIYCEENGYWSTFNSDRYGFNNPDVEWDAKEIEYLLIGDSFVKGACVNRPNDIASVLRNLSNKSILNLGVDGAAPLIEYAALKEYLDPKVKKVIWVYYEGNDAKGLVEELKLLNLVKYTSDLNYTQSLKTKQKKIDEMYDALIVREEKKILDKNKKNKIKISIKLDKKEELKQFLKLKKTRIILDQLLPYKNRHSRFSGSNNERPVMPGKFKEILQLTKDLVSKNNAELYFIYLPEFNRYKNNKGDINYLRIKKMVNSLDIPLIDMHKEVFEKERNPLDLFPFGLNGHYNIKGYKKVAEEIYKITLNK